MGIRISEHQSYIIKNIEGVSVVDGGTAPLLKPLPDFNAIRILTSAPFNNSSYRYLVQSSAEIVTIRADYCIGLDWLGNTGRTLHVEPKLNKKTNAFFVEKLDQLSEEKEEATTDNSQTQFEKKDEVQLNYLQMLLDVMSIPQTAKEAERLVQMDWAAKPILINQQDDQLSPFLIIKFLQLLKHIVRKGLKKSYYKKRQNLVNRVKGKILVGPHLKQNIFKNRLTHTICEYQVFGEDSAENRLLKKALQFSISYIENHKEIFSHIKMEAEQTVNYCRPAFEQIGDVIEEYELKHFKANPFFKEYREAIKTGLFILKRFSYNISHMAQRQITTPPFWIDMPLLFELHVYYQLLKANPGLEQHILYQFSTYGNVLDILITHDDYKIVVDAKYKTAYSTKDALHQDIRQVAGYARLKQVRKKLGLNDEDDRNVDCVIIYPDITLDKGTNPSLSLSQLTKIPIKAYHKVFKLGVYLPLISSIDK